MELEMKFKLILNKQTSSLGIAQLLGVKWNSLSLSGLIDNDFSLKRNQQMKFSVAQQ